MSQLIFPTDLKIEAVIYIIFAIILMAFLMWTAVIHTKTVNEIHERRDRFKRLKTQRARRSASGKA